MDEVPIGPLLTLLVEPAVRASSAQGRAKRFAQMVTALGEIVAGDQALSLEIDDGLFAQIGGPDEASLRRAVLDLQARSSIPITPSAPQVGFREAIGAAIETVHTHKRQGAFARIKLRVARRSGGFAFEPCAAALPPAFLAGVVSAVEGMARGGPLHGYSVIATGVSVLDGAWHERDSTPQAFAAAARAAFGEAMALTGGLLEPVMRVEIAAPATYRGSVEGDVVSRRGTIERRAVRDDILILTALVPLANCWATTPISGRSPRGPQATK